MLSNCQEMTAIYLYLFITFKSLLQNIFAHQSNEKYFIILYRVFISIMQSTKDTTLNAIAISRTSESGH